VRVVLCALILMSVAGCAARGPVNVSPKNAPQTASAPRSAEQPPADTLAVFMSKVRKLSAEARPARQAPATVEAMYPGLAAAAALALSAPSSLTLRGAAEEYRRVGIFDKALDFLTKALAIDPRDAATHDAIARLWRDSGLAQLGLGDAHRAVFFDPYSPVVHNTLGTIFQALGRRTLARTEYERALQLDGAAAYALNNLCYGWVLEGDVAKAIATCEHALRINPQLTAARNNLGLAHAVGGNVAAASEAFAQAGDRAAERYNTGIVRLAQHDFNGAIAAFESARAARPSIAGAEARAIQARAAKEARSNGN
jgi:Flp pilus assembly protein TadD